MGDLRHRMDGIFWLLTTDAPWREVPRDYGAAGTVARHFRRLTHACLWERLLQALYDAAPTHPLQGLRRVIFRAARRAYRIRGLRILVLARRLHLLEALPGPSWMLPDPDLSQSLRAWQMRAFENPDPRYFRRFILGWGRTIRHLLTLAGGRRHIPRAIRLAMP
jgi:transposase